MTPADRIQLAARLLYGGAQFLYRSFYPPADFRNQFVQTEHIAARLVLQDVLTLDGAQFADAALIVASPPCQAYSYMAMPWSRAKAAAAAYTRDILREALTFADQIERALSRLRHGPAPTRPAAEPA